MKLVASDATIVALPDTGHWVLEERQDETIDALQRFLPNGAGRSSGQ